MLSNVLVPVDVKDANELGLLGAADGEAIVDALDDPGEELRVDALSERVASIARLYRVRKCTSQLASQSMGMPESHKTS